MKEDARDTQLMEDLLGKKYVVGGVELRPPSMSSFAVLRAGGSGLLNQGISVDSAPEMEVLTFIVLLDGCRTAKEAYALTQDKDKLVDACLEIGQSISFSDMNALTQKIGEYLREAVRNKVEIIPDASTAGSPKT